jgi:hypothetical protein
VSEARNSFVGIEQLMNGIDLPIISCDHLNGLIN